MARPPTAVWRHWRRAPSRQSSGLSAQAALDQAVRRFRAKPGDARKTVIWPDVLVDAPRRVASGPPKVELEPVLGGWRRMVRGWVVFALGMALVTRAWAAAPPPPPPALAAYSRLPAMESVALSPSGERYAYVGQDRGERKIIARTAGGRGLAMVPIGEVKVRGLQWAGEKRLLITTTQTANPIYGGGLKREMLNVLSFDVETGKQFWVLADGARSTGVLGQYRIYPQDGRWFGVYAGWTVTKTRLGDSFDYSSPDLFRVDLETGAAVRVADGTEADDMGRGWVVDGAGKPLVQIDYNGLSTNWRITASDGGAVLASGVDPRGDAWLVGLGRAPGLFLYQQRDADGGVRLREASAKGGAPSVILDNDDIAGLLTDPVSGLLLGYDPAGDLSRSTAFDPALQTRLAKVGKAFPGQSLRLESWNADASRIILHASGGTESGVWWLIDTAAGKAEELGWDYPEVAPEQMGLARMVTWKAADGLAISGVLTLPPSSGTLGREAKGLPVVVLPHGGPTARDTLEFDWTAQAFASRGYAVLQPNFRGSTGYGQGFEAAGHGEWGGKMQTDVSDGLAFLAAQGVVDPKRACVVGGSYGGYVALAGVTLQQGLYRCAVAYAGVSDLRALWKQDARRHGGGTVARRQFLETIGAGEDLKERSPIDRADRADAPVLLIHGADDTVVDFAQSAAMEKALKAAGKPVRLIRLVGEDHWRSRPETRAAFLDAAVAFVEANNPAN
jgi:dipeptidyl aminopeptidase/acylaminoacyl peptidase